MINVNAHLHTPYSFSAFKDVNEALDMAVAEGVKVLGINDFYTTAGYEAWAIGCKERGLYPLFNIEFISLNEADQKAGLRVNDPVNPGRTYLSGKGLSYPFRLAEPFATQLAEVTAEANAQVEAMCGKVNEILAANKDLRMEEFELPQIKDNEILAKVVSDSLCMSSYKASIQATDHKRIPNNIAENPIIIGHEFAGELVEVGSKWADKFKAGDKFSIQPALYYEDGPVGILSAPGYSYQHIGGDATYVIIPKEVMEKDCLLAYKGEGFYPASLAEPLSCVIGAISTCKLLSLKPRMMQSTATKNLSLF